MLGGIVAIIVSRRRSDDHGYFRVREGPDFSPSLAGRHLFGYTT